ncbi:MAG: hypothetical protein ACOCYE_07885 [Pseudomonadota bacterium]
MTSARLACLVLLAGSLGGPAAGSELAFSFQSRMPEATGVLERSVVARDPAAGLSVTKQVFTQQAGDLAIRTHVAEVTCGEAGVAPGKRYMTAVQVVQRNPQSFAAAALLDGYREVYVEDETGRIRLYRDVPGYVMAELTDRFRPSCPAI